MLLVPSITKNLLSISKLTSDNNISVEFCGNICFVKDKVKGQILLQGLAKKGLYKLQFESTSHPHPVESYIASTSHPVVSYMSVTDSNKPLSQLSFIINSQLISNKCDTVITKICFNAVSTNCTQNVDQLALLH